jgi:glycosyltransferase involved in cell wall biosynthesis
MNPVFSVITVSFNSEDTIEETINSVLSQRDINYEYIIIDGKSTDKTYSIINKYSESIDKIISEKDNGLYDAMNKGIALSRGKYISIINSDDYYTNNHVLYDVMNVFSKENVDTVFGNIYYFNKKNKNIITRAWEASQFNKGSFVKGWHPPHPAFIVKKSLYDKIGVYNTNYKIVSDYDFMLRAFEINQISSYHIDNYLIAMREGGISTKNIFSRLLTLHELRLVLKKNGIRVNFIIFCINRLVPKIINKVKAFLYKLNANTKS